MRWGRGSRVWLRALAAAGALSLVLAGVLARSALAQPSPAPPVTVDGPSGDISSLNGLSVARDGTGGLVYVKAAHVFVSALVGGRFQAPVQVDAGLGGASSQPVIAAGNGGVLLVGFINGGGLYVVQRTSPTASYGSPQPLATGAINPSLQMSNLGKAYLAFAVADGRGHDVRAAYWANGSWALEAPALNAITAGDDAGTGAGAPQVATAGDGVGIVVWGEGQHVYSRRVWGTAPSVVSEQADVSSFGGCNEVSADQAVVASGGNSSYADVVFHEVLACGAARQARVLVNRLRGSQYDGVAAADGLTSPGAESADDPQVAVTEYGQGFTVAAQEVSNDVIAMDLGNNGAYGPVQTVNALPDAAPPYPVTGIAGLFSAVIAWQQTPGSSGPSEIRARYQPRADTLSPEFVASSPGQGPTDAARGLATGGDVGGDAAIAWVQGTGSSTQIVVEQLYQPPGAAGVPRLLSYVRTPQPVLAWSPSGARWGPITYTVTVDGVQVAQTGATSLQVPAPLHDGTHTWSITATNPAGLSSAPRTARVFVDTVVPRLAARVAGTRRAGAPVTLRLSYRDPQPGSGVAKLTVRWGDGRIARPKVGVHRLAHAYRRPGRYRITIVIVDKAGNQSTLVERLQIKKLKPAHKPGGKRR